MDRPDELSDPQDASSSSAHLPSSHPEQEHPVQDAHGGSMAPGLVDDTGRPVADLPDTSSS
jgi:hypothetical protein